MSDQCLQVEKKIFKEIIMHIHFITDTCTVYDHALAQ